MVNTCIGNFKGYPEYTHKTDQIRLIVILLWTAIIDVHEILLEENSDCKVIQEYERRKIKDLSSAILL